LRATDYSARWLFDPLLIVALALLLAAEMHRRQKASGIKTDWTKTVVTGFGSIVVSLCGKGVPIGGIEGDYLIAGVILCVIVLARGWPWLQP
jgi:hypothetical protein